MDWSVLVEGLMFYGFMALVGWVFWAICTIEED